jgi:hypothetical protein
VSSVFCLLSSRPVLLPLPTRVTLYTIVKSYHWLFLAIGSLALAQQGDQDKTKKAETPPPAEKKERAPLFQGKLGIRSSEQKKDSASMGFNGIDPSGKVDAKMLATTPGAGDKDKVAKLSSSRPTEQELMAFLNEGGLNKK